MPKWALVFLTCAAGPPLKCEYIDMRGVPEFTTFEQCRAAGSRTWRRMHINGSVCIERTPPAGESP